MSNEAPDDIAMKFEPATSGGWYATDDNTYDGAPDSGTNQVGHGITVWEAARDLIDQLEDFYEEG